MQHKRFHYGWIILIVGWLIYGFGIAPGYYSWGQLLPTAIDELGLDRTQAGLVFGLFTLLYSCSAPLSGLLMNRFGVRALMVLGTLISSCGFLVMSRAQGLPGSLMGFSVLAGLGMGLGVFLPTQTLANNWFQRYRATSIAVLMTAGGIVGRVVPRFDEAMVANAGWREAWLVIAGCSAVVALLALIFVRNTPESVGLYPDCRFSPPDDAAMGAQASKQPSASSALDPDWDPASALRTKHFAALTFCAIAFATPWGVAVAHGPLHLRDLGFPGLAVASVMGWMILMSIVGRLSGLVGDWIRPQRALAIALTLEAIGTIGFLWSPTKAIALGCAVMLGLGFGAAYVSVAATFGAFFGRRAFSVTMGTRMALTGLVNAAMPIIAGRFFDQTGSYLVPFVALASITSVGAIIAWVIQSPVPPTKAH